MSDDDDKFDGSFILKARLRCLALSCRLLEDRPLQHSKQILEVAQEFYEWLFDNDYINDSDSDEEEKEVKNNE